MVRDRHKRTLDLIESHACELLRLLAEAKRLDTMSKQLFEAWQGHEGPPPDTIRELRMEEEEDFPF